jgi:hypothetical protein
MTWQCYCPSFGKKKVVTRSRGCKEVYNIFKANPTVECYVFRKQGKEVIYA